MRITGGIYGGRRLKCPPGVIRPAMDRMRESVFAILGDLQSLSFLDLYSGSGAIGIEAASRGAGPVTFVEMDRKKLSTLKENISIIESATEVIGVPAQRYLRSNKKKFDIIFADPPFSFKHKETIMDLSCGSIEENGLFIIHYPSSETLIEETEHLILRDVRRYGGSMVNFYGEKL